VAATITEYIEGELPPWLATGNALNFVGVLAGLMRDRGLEADMFAGMCGFLQTLTIPQDGVAYIGTERMLRKFDSESFDQYQSRLLKAWDAWALAGSGSTVLDQLALLGVTAELQNTFTWDWGPTPAQALSLPGHRYMWVVLRGHTIGNPAQWGDGWKWGDGTTWGGSASDAQKIAAVRAIVKQFKEPHVECMYIIVVHDLVTWDANPPAGNWDDPTNWPSTAVATFWPGVL